MISAGIIAEYNPFHLGHQYHIQKTRELTGADCIVVIMSGDFVQRGEPAVMNKYLRASCALTCGADLVVELPVISSLSSAEGFAMDGVCLLEKAGVNFLSFGSELGVLAPLSEVAGILSNEPDFYKAELQKQLASGNSFPKAKELAFTKFYGEYAPLLSSPNNILGIEYLKAISSGNFRIQPITIPRKGDDYHENRTTSETFASATALRECLKEGRLQTLQKFIPKEAYCLLAPEYRKTFPILADDFSTLLSYRLRLLCAQKYDLTKYADISPALSNRIQNLFQKNSEPLTFSQTATVLKTKELTYSRIMRSLMHILLNHTVEDFTSAAKYLRILGFSRTGQKFLSGLKKNTDIPIITKTALSKELIEKDTFASTLYQQIVFQKYGTILSNDFTHGIIRRDVKP